MRYGLEKGHDEKVADGRVSWDTNFFQSIGMVVIVRFDLVRGNGTKQTLQLSRTPVRYT